MAMEVAYEAAFFGGLAIFFGTHYFSMLRKRDGTGIADRIGRGPYMGLYSLITIVGFVLMAWGFAFLKPWIPIYTPPTWGRHVTMALMLPAIILIVATYMPPAGFIKKAAKHPMLLAVKIWAFAHLWSNGDLATIILFGSFLIYGVADRIAVKRRGDVGAAKVNANVLGDLLSIAVGIAVYLLLIYELHYMLFGVGVLAG
jgi:uncharacterized membrane protein